MDLIHKITATSGVLFLITLLAINYASHYEIESQREISSPLLHILVISIMLFFGIFVIGILLLIWS